MSVEATNIDLKGAKQFAVKGADSTYRLSVTYRSNFLDYSQARQKENAIVA